MIQLIGLIGFVSAQIAGADGWTIGQDPAQPFCLIERVGTGKLVAVQYNAVEGKSAIVFAASRAKKLALASGKSPAVVLSSDGKLVRELTSLSVRRVKFPNGSDGLVFETETDGFLNRLVGADALSVLDGDQIILYMPTPDLRIALDALEACSKQAKIRLLNSL